MKLLNLKVWGYKNFEDVEINFSSSQRNTLIVGTNGSGKSNLLEILSAIFAACYQKAKNVMPDFRFELIYVIEHYRSGAFSGNSSYQVPIVVRLRNPDGIIMMEIQNTYSDWEIINDIEFESLLPEHVVAVYSGEEKRLWENYYFSSYDDYNKQYMSGKAPYQSQKMIYLNMYYWNLIASILKIHDVEEFGDFLKTSIGLDEVYCIHCKFDITKMKANRNAMAKEMLQIINPEQKEEVEISFNDYNRLKEVCGYESDVFYNMLVLTLYKDYKIITELTLKSTNGIEIKDLSEGEKKLLLIYGAINIVTGENLYLLDEPDAHLHEGRKKEIFDLIQTVDESHFVITSHSPSLTYMFPVESLQVLVKQDGKVNVLEEDKKRAIHHLTDGIWCAESQCILLESNQDLLLVEGKGDTRYIKKAISYWKGKDEKYSGLNLFILPFGGTGNCADFIENIMEAGVVDRRIVALFDADGSGREKFAKLVGISGSNYTTKVYDVNDKTKALLLPKPVGNTNTEFMIEDYFDLSGYEAERERKYSLCDGAKAKSEFKFSTKKYISEHCDEIGYEGFKILCDKLLLVLDDFSTREEQTLEKELVAV